MAEPVLPESDPFDSWIEEAISQLPDKFKEELKNVSIVLEDEPTQYQQENSMLLGLYQGIPNPYKGPHYTFTMPDKISLYRNNILAIANYRSRSIPEIIAEVLYHEIGHLLGMSEAELDPYKSF
jgi:predicted Zn-dependent protease with MMP-like domain